MNVLAKLDTSIHSPRNNQKIIEKHIKKIKTITLSKK